MTILDWAAVAGGAGVVAMSGPGRAGSDGTARGGVQPVVVLLAGILVALVGLIVVLATQGGLPGATGGGTGAGASQAVADGQHARRTDVPDPPPAPKPIADPERIRASLPVGRTTRSLLKVGIQARVEDKHWWRREVINLAYAAEMQVDRTIEENDGRRLVELRHFVAARNAKLLCEVEDARIDLGAPGTLLLGALYYIKPEAGAVATAAKPIADAILRRGAQSRVDEQSARAVAHVDSLEGKKVRIAYVDGVGVESILPVGCTLSGQERDFLFATAPLSDFYILKDVRSRPGDEWAAEGAQLAGLIDPSLRGRPSGEVVIRRKADEERDGKRYALLTIRGGSVEIDASDASARRIGSFAPEGDLEFCLTDGLVRHAALMGRFRIERASKDHLLFETHFRTEPMLSVDYACGVR